MDNQYNTPQEPVKFNVAGALAEGYTMEEIGQAAGFDVVSARNEGYSDEEITSYLSGGVEPQVTVTVGEPQVVATEQMNPMGVTNLDTKTSVPSVSIPMGMDPSKTDYINLDMDPDQLKEQLDKKYDYYKDPRSGKIIPSSRISGEVEPAYDYLPGGGSKLGLFSLNAAIEAGRAAPEVASHIGDYMAKARPEMVDLALDPHALSPGAKILIATHVDVPEEQIINILQGVPSQDQSLHLALALHDTDFIKHAVAMGNDQTRAKLANILKAPNKALMDAMGDTGKQMVEAQIKYSDMVKTTQQMDQGKLRPVKELQELTTKLLDQFYLQPNNAQGTIRRLSAQIERNGGNLTLTDAVDMMPEINSLLGKAKSHNERAILKQLKDTMDESITKLGTPEHRKLFDEARESYAAAKSNEAIVGVVQKYTADMGRGTDWAKVHKELNDLELRSPETADALRLTEAFANKYGNNTKLARTATPQGINENSGGALGAWGYVVNRIKNVALKDRREAMKVQKEILKAINRNGTELEFLDEVLRNPKIPNEAKYTFSGTSDWQSLIKDKSPEELIAMAQNDGALDVVMANAMKANISRLIDSGIDVHMGILDGNGVPDSLPIGAAAKAGDLADEMYAKDSKVMGGNFYDNGTIYNWFKSAGIPDEDKAVLVAHELNHTATRGGLKYAAENPGTPEAAALEAITGIMDTLKQADPHLASKDYMQSVHEFVAYSMTDPKLKAKLSNMEFDRPEVPTGTRSIWDDMLDSMWELQSDDMGPARKAYEQLVDRTLTIMGKNHVKYEGTGVETTAHMFDTRDLGLSPDQEVAVRNALTTSSRAGDYKPVKSLPQATRQSLADELFNSRDPSIMKGTSEGQEWNSASEVGITTKMPPSAFLKLAANRNNTLVDYIENSIPMKGYDLDTDSRPYKKMVDTIDSIARKNKLDDVREALKDGDFEYVNDLILEHGLGEQLNKAMGIGSTRLPGKAKNFARDITKDLASGSVVKLAPPKLWGEVKDGMLVISDHNGRHRSDALLEMLGSDINIPVDFELKSGTRGTPILDLPIVNQDGSRLNITLRKLLPTGFDTSKLEGANLGLQK
jgi:hypothetical protein